MLSQVTKLILIHLKHLNFDIAKMWVFDLLIWNSDRHGGNFLIKKINDTPKIFAIDHGYCFSSGSLRTQGLLLLGR